MHDDSQPLPPSPDAASPTQPSLAPWQHTVAIIALFAIWCAIGDQRARSVAVGPHILTYLSSIMVGWMALGTVVAGLYHRRQFFLDTLRQNPRRWYVDAGRGVLIYISALFMFFIVLSALRFTTVPHNVDRSVLLAMAPQNIRELLVWTLVSLTAGFCEEHVFRGYLLPQVIALCRAFGASHVLAVAFAVVSTSALFGALHLYEGVEGAIMIGMLGMFYSLLALRLGNLRAIIVAHFMQDFITAATILSRHKH